MKRLKNMNKLYVLYNQKQNYAAEIVIKACIRSFTKAQVEALPYNKANGIPGLSVLLEPEEEWLKDNLPQLKGKSLILGRPPRFLADYMGFVCHKEQIIENVTQQKGFRSSNLFVRYARGTQTDELVKNLSLEKRYLSRCDHADGWNNHGYGAITLSQGSPYAISCHTGHSSDNSLAKIFNMQGDFVTEYACLKNEVDASVLWFNRTVGTTDSLEWTVVENFFANYRTEELPCLPFLSEIPAGFTGAMTMRLDCDQAISTARTLFELYLDEEIPMTLAITTGNDITKADKKLVCEVLENGGSVLSHSQHHFPNWGGCYLGAYLEALGSRFWLEKNIGKNFGAYAVSPFHQNPDYAVKALSDAGYKGFVGGLIQGEPQYIMSRGGQVPFLDAEMVSLSQQCMLHGDCFHQYGNSIEPYEECFDEYYKANGIFGYLDHPFSATDKYGWLSEEERVKVHQKLINYSKQHQDVWYCNLREAMQFILDRSRVNIRLDEEKGLQTERKDTDNKHFTIVYRNKTVTI